DRLQPGSLTPETGLSEPGYSRGGQKKARLSPRLLFCCGDTAASGAAARLAFADGALDAAADFLGDALALHAGTADGAADGLAGFAAGDIARAAGLVDGTGFHDGLFRVDNGVPQPDPARRRLVSLPPQKNREVPARDGPRTIPTDGERVVIGECPVG